jgi:MFS transporter, LPLT family, lysophospholipid transporter
VNRSFYFLLGGQFLSAFADNAILFVVIAMVMKSAHTTSWYVSALQSAFLVAFVVLAPWVGRFADGRPKPTVLIIGNLLKAIGTLLILLDVEPLLAYGIVGMGAAVYAPAKYGILPELVGSQTLVRANGWIEGATILAILSGTVLGGNLADYSIRLALILVLVSYCASAGVTFCITKLVPRQAGSGPAVQQFLRESYAFLGTARARFAIVGAGVFWAAAAVLRVIIIAWAPRTLGMQSAGDIAELTLFLGVGTIIGAAVVPRLIPIEQLRRARLAAYAMSAMIAILAAVTGLHTAQLTLLGVGIAGGIFVVPINAALQEVGHQTIGAGSAVAIQGFFENSAMLLAIGAYGFAAARGADPGMALLVVGSAVLMITLLVSLHLPRVVVSTEVARHDVD